MAGSLFTAGVLVLVVVALVSQVCSHRRAHARLDARYTAEALEGPQWPPRIVTGCTCGYRPGR